MTSLALPFVLGIAARATALLLLALGVTTLLRRASAATRHLVWTVALGGVLVLPFLGSVVPAWRVVPVPAELAPAVSRPPEPVVAEAEPAEAAAHESAPARAPEAPRTDWAAWIVGVWLAGSALVLARLAAGVVRIWWVERRSLEMADTGWISLTDSLTRRLRLGRMVTLLRGEHAAVPMTWGILRPVVLLPAESDGWSEERRTVVLAHELAHIRRWDALTQWVAHLAVAVHWYNPLVWAAARRLRQEREQACDDAVLALGARPTVYADHLLDIVRSLGTASGPAAALAMARRSQFEGRLLAILDAAVPRTGVGRAVALATLAGGALCVLPLAALSVADPAAPAAVPLTFARVIEPHERVVPEVGDHPRADEPTGEAAGLPPRPLSSPVAPLAAPLDTPLAARLAPTPPTAALAPAPRANLEGDLSRAAAALQSTGALISTLRAGSGADLYGDIIRAAAAIQSSTERRLVLDELLRRPDLRREHVLAILDATHTMSSDADRRLVLVRAASHRALGGELPPAVAGAIGRFTSSAEQRVAMVEFMNHLRAAPSVLVPFLQLAARMESDTEKRIVLAAAARRFAMDGPVREAYMAVVRGMESDTERRLALSALASRAPASRPAAPGLWNTDLELVGAHDGEPAYELTLRARGVRLSRDSSDVVEVAQGGSLYIEHVLFPGGAEPAASATVTRTLNVRRGADGGVVRSYRVDGRERDFGAEGRAWLAALLRRSR